MNCLKFAIGLSLGMAAIAGIARAESEFSFSVSAGATHSDNVARQSTDEDSDTTIDAGLQLSLADDEGRLQSRIAADLLYRHYTDDTFDDELTGGLDGNVTYWFAPERFAWAIENSYGQALIDAREVDTAGNRQNVNIFSTGPDFLLRLGDRTELQIQGRWTNAYFEEGEANNEQLSGSLGLSRRLSERSSVSLNGSSMRIEYDDSPPNSDYDLHSVSLGFAAEGARSTLDLQAGYTSLHDLGESTDGPLFSLMLSRRLSERSTLTLNVGTNLMDTAQAFRRDFGIGGVGQGTGDAVVSPDPFQSDYASLAWQTNAARTGVSIGLDWRQEDHETSTTLDRESLGANVAFTRRLGPRLSARLFGDWNTQEFDSPNVEFDEWSAGLGFDWTFAGGYSLSLSGEHANGSGDTAVGIGQRDYEENRISLRIAYSPGR